MASWACAYPWLVSSEWLHYGYAIVMLIGLFLLRPGFVGRARTWWTVALAIQFWHHIEHLLLLLQVQTGHYLLSARPVPTSVAPAASFPRVELHLFYNSVVFIPMLVAMYLHLRPNDHELQQMQCTCVPRGQRTADARVVRRLSGPPCPPRAVPWRSLPLWPPWGSPPSSGSPSASRTPNRPGCWR